MIDQENLKELLLYIPETGEFVWRKGRPGASSGNVAGSMNDQGYWRIGVAGKRYLAHRLAWLYSYGVFPFDQIDHINGNRSDNRLCNLRAVDNAENHRNLKRPADNTSGHIGVYWESRRGLWLAQIKSGGRRIHLGYFDKKERAAEARKAAEAKYGFHKNHGRHA